MEIEKTYNYNKFKIYKVNRKISEKNIKRIMASVKCRNLLSINPIIVSEDFDVIDGQHRLEVCRRMELPVYYTIYKGSDAYAALECLNTAQEKWKIDDHLNFHQETPLAKFITMWHEKTGITASTIFRTFFRDKLQGAQTSISDVFTRNEEYERLFPFAEEILGYLQSIYERIQLPVREMMFFKNGNFVRAVRDLYKNPEIDRDILADKIAQQYYNIPRVNNFMETKKAIVSVYNRGRRKPNHIKA